MRRTWVLAFSICFLFLCTSGSCQSTSNEAQGMQALVVEVRQLRKDLQTSRGYALKAQVLLSRSQFQQAAVARASERLSDARARVAVAQKRRQEVAGRAKQFEESMDNTESSPADQKQNQAQISAFKLQLENLATDEQQTQTAETEFNGMEYAYAHITLRSMDRRPSI